MTALAEAAKKLQRSTAGYGKMKTCGIYESFLTGKRLGSRGPHGGDTSNKAVSTSLDFQTQESTNALVFTRVGKNL